jgi:pyrroline-5-carboxylate reductase
LMADAAIGLGLAPQPARRLALATLYGAGLLAHASDGDLAHLRAQVTSKGGTTEAAVNTFNAAELRATVARAMEAATRRSREIAASSVSPR